MKIGVLALQGAFAEHIKMLEKLGVESFEIRKKMIWIMQLIITVLMG